jgi:hypothetical protein
MIAVAGATWNLQGDIAAVRKDFYHLSLGLSVFYLSLLLGLILCQPITNPHDVLGQLKSLQNSNLATGPIQGLVASAFGALFSTGKPNQRISNDPVKLVTVGTENTDGSTVADPSPESADLEGSDA